MLSAEFSKKADKFLDKAEKELAKRIVGANKKPNRIKLRGFLKFVGSLFHLLQAVGIQTQQTIKKLQLNPFPQDMKRVENQWFENEKIFRIRVGDYRVLYTVNHQKNRVLVVDIDKRSHVY